MNQPFDPLLKYAEHILTGSIVNLRPPAGSIPDHPSLGETDGSGTPGIHSVILDRQGPFQAELFLVPTEVKTIVQHVHPGVDSYEYNIAGDFEFIIDGISYSTASNGLMLLGNSQLVSVPATMLHGGNFGSGGCFLSFQHWLDVPPTSVSDSFLELSK